MPQNFIGCAHDQVFLMPPDVREWLPEGHLAWFGRAAVEEMDLLAFYGAYRSDGHGRAAYEPSMMVAVVLYADARGVRSSRAIERACEEDVAYRVLAATRGPITPRGALRGAPRGGRSSTAGSTASDDEAEPRHAANGA